MSIQVPQQPVMQGYGAFPNQFGYAPFNPQMTYGTPMFYGAPQQPVVKPKNPIGQKGYDLLRARNGRINFNPTEEEIFRCLCTHVHDGNFMMVRENPNSNVLRCQICDTVVDFDADFDPDVLDNILKYLEGAWNHIKIMNNGVLGDEILRDMGASMVLMKRIPAMYDLTSKQFNKVVNAANGIMNYGGIGMQNLQAITNNSGFGYIPTMPVNNPYGQPMMQSQLGGMNPFMGPVTPMGQPMMPQTPQAPMMYQPMSQQPAMAPQAPAMPQPTSRVLVDPATGQQVIVPMTQQPGYVSPFANPQTPPPAAAGTVMMGQPATAPQAPAAPAAAPEQNPANGIVTQKTYNG